MNTEHTPPRARALGLAVALAGALVVPRIAPAAVAAPIAAAAAADSFPAEPDLLMHPPDPCIETPVTFYVRGYQATSCDSFIYAYRRGDDTIVIRTIMRSDVRCFAGPSVFYAVPIPFGLLPAGTRTVTIERHRLSWSGNPASIDSVVATSEVSFTVRDACPDPPLPVPATQLPYVTAARTLPIQPCDDRATSLELSGFLPNGCSTASMHESDRGLQLVIAPYYGPALCGPAGVWSGSWNLGFLATGSHFVSFEQTILGSNDFWPPIFDQRQRGFFEFNVASQCDSSERPLPFVDSIHVGRVMPRLTNWPICPGEPYRVSLAGTFPTPCYVVRRVDVLEGYPTPVVRVVVDTRACSPELCQPEAAPWDTSVVLPGLPAGDYRQDVQIAEVACTDSILPHQLWTTQVPFSVFLGMDCDSLPPTSCLLPSWKHGSGGCDAFIAKDAGAQLDLQVMTGTALSGLQGDLRFHALGLRIVNVEAIGPAAGMHVSWTPTEDGNARFVMFAEHGAPIPASSEPVAIVRVSVQPAAIRVPWPSEGFYLYAERILGADVNGNEVPYCPTVRFVAIATVAHICVERPCDFDGNGVADVRDLVRMVHCVHGEGPCPADTTNQFDCDGNGGFGLDDVLCCAAHVLQGPSCPTCPVDTVRAEPDVRATFESPFETEGEITVPIRLWHSDRVGAARLALRFPGDRYRLADVEMHESAWLQIHEGAEGEASVGLIRIAPDITLVSPMSATVLVRLALKPGARPGGEMVLEAGELSGRDGVMLDVDLGRPVISLDGQPNVRISSVRPNPSAGTFRISLSLAAAARIDVAVHDIAGRRVATVFQGDRTIGTHEFAWDGMTSDGIQARGGVYFLRATASGEAVVKKIILLNRRSGPAQAPIEPR